VHSGKCFTDELSSTFFSLKGLRGEGFCVRSKSIQSIRHSKLDLFARSAEQFRFSFFPGRSNHDLCDKLKVVDQVEWPGREWLH
jgi:hypothetical protein